MPRIEPTIEHTEDGTPTLRHPVFGDTYHSLHGAVTEKRHVFVTGGFDAHPGREVRILEVGFGSGLNAWLTACRAAETGRRVGYHTLELYPVPVETAEQLRYTDDPLFMALHRTPWDTMQEISPAFRLIKREEDLINADFDTIFDIVYFDAFAPDTQPEMWTVAIFRRIYNQMSPGGILVTYSAKGTVKQALRSAGFEVARLPGAPGKRHMIRAIRPDHTDKGYARQPEQ